MVKMKNNQKGITLVALTITIILMLVLATVTSYSIIDSYRKSKIMKFITEMQLIQDKVDELAQKGQLYSIGQPASTKEEGTRTLAAVAAKKELQSGDEINQEYYRYLSINDIANYLDIDDATSDILVNYKTREVISVDGVEYNGELHYTQYNLPGGQKIIFGDTYSGREMQAVTVSPTIDGLNATLTISNITITNGTLSYKLSSSEAWTTITNYTKAGDSYEVSISVSGIYTFKLIDNIDSNTSVETEFNIVLTNAPKLEEDMTLKNDSYNYTNYDSDFSTWSYATKPNVAFEFVWIPRYAYDGEGNIKFIRGNSRIATDDTYLDEETWTVPLKFNKNATGIWVEASQRDLLPLINNNQ